MGSHRASLRRLLLPAPACLAALLLVAGCSLQSRPATPVATPRPFAAVTPSAPPVQSITEPQMPQAPSEAEPVRSQPPAQEAEGSGASGAAPAPAPAEEAPAQEPVAAPDAASEPEPIPEPEAEPEPQAYYANCTEAHAAGVTPLYRGDSGYGTHLDRDEDGIACEKK